MTLLQFQTNLCEKLQQDPVLIASKLSVLAEDSTTIEFDSAQAIDKIGIFAVVVTPDGVFAGNTPNDGISVALKGLKIRISEAPAVNRNRANAITALGAAQRIAVLLHSPACLFTGFAQEESPDGTIQVTVDFNSQYTLYPNDTNP